MQEQRSLDADELGDLAAFASRMMLMLSDELDQSRPNSGELLESFEEMRRAVGVAHAASLRIQAESYLMSTASNAAGGALRA